MNIGKFGVIPVCILFHLVCRLAYIDYTRRANISFFVFIFCTNMFIPTVLPCISTIIISDGNSVFFVSSCICFFLLLFKMGCRMYGSSSSPFCFVCGSICLCRFLFFFTAFLLHVWLYNFVPPNIFREWR